MDWATLNTVNKSGYEYGRDHGRKETSRNVTSRNGSRPKDPDVWLKDLQSCLEHEVKPNPQIVLTCPKQFYKEKKSKHQNNKTHRDIKWTACFIRTALRAFSYTMGGSLKWQSSPWGERSVSFSTNQKSLRFVPSIIDIILGLCSQLSTIITYSLKNNGQIFFPSRLWSKR